MSRPLKKYKIYYYLVFILAFFSVLSVYLPQSSLIPMEEIELSKSILALANLGIVLLIYGPLGYIGLKLSEKVNLTANNLINPKIWLKKSTVAGVLLGVIFIMLDLIFASAHGLGLLPHPSFFAGIIASITAGIGEEIIFRLFFITFWYWFIGYIIFRKKYNNIVYWSISCISAILFTVGHLPSIMYLYGFKSFTNIPLLLLLELLLMNGTLSLIAASYYRKYGIFAAMNTHFVLDIIWHVLWGLV